jgi:hypothetical protein
MGYLADCGKTLQEPARRLRKVIEKQQSKKLIGKIMSGKKKIMSGKKRLEVKRT